MSLTPCWSVKRYDETGVHIMCNVTHHLLVKGKDVLRLLKMCNATHILFARGKDVMRMPFTKCAMSLTSCWSVKRCDETSVHMMCNVTHLLFVKGKDVMSPKMWNATYKLLVIRKKMWWMPFTKCAISHTHCWSEEKMWWDCLSQNVECHSLPAGASVRRINSTREMSWM